MAGQRILRAVPATLEGWFWSSVGDPKQPAGPVTVGVVDASGTSVLAAGTAATIDTAHPGRVTVALSAAQTARLNLLTATWVDAASGTTVASAHEVVGGFLFSLDEARRSSRELKDPATYSDADIYAARQEVEEEVEWICDVAFVPRYRRVTLDGTGVGELILPGHRVRTIRSVKTISSVTGAQAYTFTADDLANIVIDPSDGTLNRLNSAIWDIGQGNVIVDFEHGWDSPEHDLKRAAFLRLRSKLNSTKSGIPDRASRLIVTGAGTYELDSPGVYKTGMPEVDSVYARYSFRGDDDQGLKPASRVLRTDPNRFSMFHGGRH